MGGTVFVKRPFPFWKQHVCPLKKDKCPPGLWWIALTLPYNLIVKPERKYQYDEK